MPQETIPQKYSPKALPSRITNDPKKALVDSALGIQNTPEGFGLNAGLQQILAMGKSPASRATGRIVGEAPLYVDSLIPLLRSLDEDVDEKDRALLATRILSLLGVNATKDAVIASATKGKGAGLLNAVTDIANPAMANVVGKYLTTPYPALGNVSAGEIAYQMGKMLPATSFLGLPAIPQLMELGAQKNIARTPFVRNARTSVERQDDVLTEDELAYQLMRLQGKDKAPRMNPDYTFTAKDNSKSQKQKTKVLNTLSKAVTAKANLVAPTSKGLMDFISDPEATMAMLRSNATKPGKRYTSVPPVLNRTERGSGGRSLPLQ
jgi:hypothetical protein